MTARKHLSAITVFMLVGLLVSLPARADSNVRIVRLSLVDGPVQLDRATGNGFERAIMNMPIAQSMQIWTRDDSRAEIEFEEGNTIRLAPGTKLEFSELVLRSDGSRRTVVRIEGGRAYVNYSRNSGEDFRVIVKDREVLLDRSAHFRVDALDERVELAVLGGELDLDNARVKKNNTLVLLPRGTYDVAKGIDAAMEDSWDKYRTDYHDKYAKSAYNGSSFYGRSDLNYYGTWTNSPYGSCWRPYGFDASWDPYQAGAWAYYPGYGYTFVSLYPWGWQPYRSGVWNFVSTGFGYCWSPNRTYYGYGWAPVVHAPSGYVPVQAPPQVTRVPGQRGPGALGMLPVGNVNTTGNWKASDPINIDRGFRGHRGDTSGVVSSGVSGGGRGSVSTAVSPSDSAPTRSNRGNRDVNQPPSSDSHMRPGRGDAPAYTPRQERGDRSIRQESPRVPEQRNVDRQPHESPRNFERQQSAPASPPPSAPAAAPAPHAAPPAPARSESRGAVPNPK